MHKDKIKIYFASDFHLGIPDRDKSFEREVLIVKWLDEIKNDATEIYLLGDIFDFWFEYKNVVPKGYVRLLGKLAEICDSGIPVHYFIGNHDMWMKDYLSTELKIILHKEPLIKTYNTYKFYIAHGDGLGDGDYGYKFIKGIFKNKTCQWLFKQLHPSLAFGLASFFSNLSRKSHEQKELVFQGEDEERLIKHSKEMLKSTYYDFIVFGHRHLPLDIQITPKTRYINLGDWIRNFSYAVFDGDNLELKKY